MGKRVSGHNNCELALLQAALKRVNDHGSFTIAHVPFYSSELREAQKRVTSKLHLVEEQKTDAVD